MSGERPVYLLSSDVIVVLWPLSEYFKQLIIVQFSNSISTIKCLCFNWLIYWFSDILIRTTIHTNIVVK